MNTGKTVSLVIIEQLCMRNVLFCLLSLFILSCQREAVIILDRAEENMSARPDSSLTLLQQIEPDQLKTRPLKARHALLLSMALDKNYIDVKDDSLARVAYDYFQHHGSKDYRMKSTYYLGVVKENAEELIDAAILFKEAEGLAEELKDYHFLGLSRQHLSGVFASNYDHNEALEYALKAENAFTKAGETLSARYSLVDAANQYQILGNIGPAERILDSLLINPDINTRSLDFYLYSQKADLFFKTNQFDQAYYYFQLAQSCGVSFSPGLLGKLATLEERNGFSYKADSLLLVIKSSIATQIDSALYYNSSHNVYICRGDYKKAYKAMITATKLQDQAVITLLNRSITHTFKSYYENRFELEKAKATSRLFIILLFAFILTSLLIYSITQVQQKNRQLMNDLSMIDDIKMDLSTLQDRNKGLSTIIHSMMENRIIVMQHLADTYFQWSDEMVSKREKKEGRILIEDAIAQFRGQIQQLRNDKQFIKEIENALNDSHDDIMKHLRANNTQLGDHTLKETDYNLLVLLFSGFSVKSISFLMNMSEQSIRTRKTRYKKWFQEKDDADSKLFVQWLS